MCGNGESHAGRVRLRPKPCFSAQTELHHPRDIDRMSLETLHSSLREIDLDIFKNIVDAGHRSK